MPHTPRLHKDLSNQSLATAYLHEADLHRAILQEADLTGADLSYADLSGCDLSFTILKGADLTGANLRGAHLYRTELIGAVLRNVSAQMSTWRQISTPLSKICLEGADLGNARWGLLAVPEGWEPYTRPPGSISAYLYPLALHRDLNYLKLCNEELDWEKLAYLYKLHPELSPAGLSSLSNSLESS